MLNTYVSAIAAEAEECRQDAIDWHTLYVARGERLKVLVAKGERDSVTIAKLTHERDMLAARCAEQARKIAELLAPPAKDLPKATILDAIRTMQAGGVR